MGLLFKDKPAVTAEKMGEALRAWISSAAGATTSDALDEHVIKHAQELVTEIRNVTGPDKYKARASWSASMHNLLDIFDAYHGIQMTNQQQIARMLAKFLSKGPRIEGEYPVASPVPVWELLESPDPEAAATPPAVKEPVPQSPSYDWGS